MMIIADSVNRIILISYKGGHRPLLELHFLLNTTHPGLVIWILCKKIHVPSCKPIRVSLNPGVSLFEKSTVSPMNHIMDRYKFLTTNYEKSPFPIHPHHLIHLLFRAKAGYNLSEGESTRT